MKKKSQKDTKGEKRQGEEQERPGTAGSAKVEEDDSQEKPKA